MGDKKTSRGLIISLVILSILIIVFSKTWVISDTKGFIEGITSPVRKEEFSLLGRRLGTDRDTKLILENQALVEKLANYNRVIEENSALRDQFQTQEVSTGDLLPASIIGSPGSVINKEVPKTLIIDKGRRDGVKIGQVVIYKDNLVGIIKEVSEKISVVETIFSEDISITAKIITGEGDIIGIIKGTGSEGLLLDNVLASDELSAFQIVLTKGDIDKNSNGSPPNLVIGKVESVDKEASNVFQRADIKSYLDFNKLTSVFIINL